MRTVSETQDQDGDEYADTAQQPAVRKYLYLITENEDEEIVGSVKELETPLATGEKNVETKSQTYEDGQFWTVGKHVGMGYVDFDTVEAYEEGIHDAIIRKLGEIDEKWLKKAGLDPEEVLG